MKKLNRKGFTLIELLAVVVVLAVILVVIIPTVLTSVATAKSRQLQNAATELSDWLTKQYEIKKISSSDLATVDTRYSTFFNATGHALTTETTNNNVTTTNYNQVTIDPSVTDAKDLMIAGGITDTTSLEGKVKLVNERICVELTAKDSKSVFYNSEDTSKNTVYSSGCSATDFSTQP